MSEQDSNEKRREEIGRVPIWFPIEKFACLTSDPDAFYAAAKKATNVFVDEMKADPEDTALFGLALAMGVALFHYHSHPHHQPGTGHPDVPELIHELSNQASQRRSENPHDLGSLNRLNLGPLDDLAKRTEACLPSQLLIRINEAVHALIEIMAEQQTIRMETDPDAPHGWESVPGSVQGEEPRPTILPKHLLN